MEKIIRKNIDTLELPFASGFLSEPLKPRENIHLLGTRCLNCGVVLLGSRDRCEACASPMVKIIQLSRRGKIWSHTVMRYVSPWPFAIPNPHQPPMPVAWVQLPEGVQIISRINCNPDDLKIGLPVELVIEKGWEDETGNDILMYKFQPEKKERK